VGAGAAIVKGGTPPRQGAGGAGQVAGGERTQMPSSQLTPSSAANRAVAGRA
jgi:hypothetical protein